MIPVFAHAGHVLVDLLYLLPLVLLMGAVVAGKLRDRREARRHGPSPEDLAPGDSRRGA